MWKPHHELFLLGGPLSGQTIALDRLRYPELPPTVHVGKHVYRQSERSPLTYVYESTQVDP